MNTEARYWRHVYVNNVELAMHFTAVLLVYAHSRYDHYNLHYIHVSDILYIMQALAGAMISRIHLFQTVLRV